MVEVFKTNVSNRDIANYLLVQLHEKFAGCKANFDLEDCDLILRIQYPDETIEVTQVVELLQCNGFTASVLSDEFDEAR